MSATSADGISATVQALPAPHDDAARRLIDIADPRRDGPSITVLAGEAGVGRSTVLTAVSSAMRDAGVEVLSGRAMHARGGSVYAALYDALLEPAAWAALPMPRRAAMLEALATAIRPDPSPHPSPEQPVIATLVGHGQERPLLIVVDNVDICGPHARRDLNTLIQGLGGARRTGVSVLLAPAAGQADGLTWLAEAFTPSLLTLDPLDEGGVAALAREVLHAEPDRAFLIRLRELTSGNSAAVRWLLGVWRRDGDVRYVDGHAYLHPDAIVPAMPLWHPVLAPLCLLGPQTWITAVALAVLGPLPASSAAARLTEVSGLATAAVLRGVDLLKRARQLHQVGNVLTFADELIRTSLAECAGVATRARWLAMATIWRGRQSGRDSDTTLPQDGLQIRDAVDGGDAVLDIVDLYRSGRWDQVLDHARRMVAGIATATAGRSRRTDMTSARIEALAALIWVRRGRPDRARKWLDRIAPEEQTSAERILAEAGLATSRGEPHLAQTMLEDWLAKGSRVGWAEVAAGLVEHTRPGLDDRVTGHEPYVVGAGTDLPDNDRLWLMLTQARSASRSHPAAAIAAIQFARHLGQPYAVARGCLIAGELDIEPGSTLGEALEIFASLRATPSWCRAAAAARVHRIRVALPVVGLDGHDEVTRVLLALLAEGLPTRVIGQVLHLGHTALEGRLSRLYATSGYRSRAELAAAFREGKLAAIWL